MGDEYLTQPDRTLASIQRLAEIFIQSGAITLQAELIGVIDHLPAHLVDRRTEFQLGQVKGRWESAIERRPKCS